MIEKWKQVLPDYIGSTDPQGLPDSSTKYLFPNPYQLALKTQTPRKVQEFEREFYWY